MNHNWEGYSALACIQIHNNIIHLSNVSETQWVALNTDVLWSLKGWTLDISHFPVIFTLRELFNLRGLQGIIE